MVAVRLWRFPPRLGGCSTVPAQLNNAVKCVAEAGSDTMDRNNDAKCEAEAARADLGMCLMRDRPVTKRETTDLAFEKISTWKS